MSDERVPAEQRVFSLVLALVASPGGLTKHELLSSVHGYAERYRPEVSNASLERQFERDKEQLRTLGIVIDTFDTPLESGNNQLTRYRISKDLLEFPEDLRFSERELMLLRLAAIAWSEGSLSADSRRALMKLESLGAGVDVAQLGVAPRLGSAEPAAAPLQAAIDELRIVRFDYTLPGREHALARRVAPLRLHRADGRWHLLAWDLDRDAGRVFLLSRIDGDVAIGRGSEASAHFDVELFDRVNGLLDELLGQRERNRATLSVRRGSPAEARLVPRALGTAQASEREVDSGVLAEATTVVVGTLDPYLLAEELAGYGADVAVVEPSSLREAVVNRLRTISAQHGPGAETEPDTDAGDADA